MKRSYRDTRSLREAFKRGVNEFKIYYHYPGCWDIYINGEFYQQTSSYGAAVKEIEKFTKGAVVCGTMK